MKLIQEKFKHATNGFVIEITTCNPRVATARNLETGETVKFNRPKLEWMIKKGVFIKEGQ